MPVCVRARVCNRYHYIRRIIDGNVSIGENLRIKVTNERRRERERERARGGCKNRDTKVIPRDISPDNAIGGLSENML